uniref:hypothetical protein n=1 Tax=Gardnerella vaginalis TaxID=2702 RepID=UPI0001E8E9FF
MTAFKVALTAKKGSFITNGTYTFKNNPLKNSPGIYLGETVKGTSKNKLKITADNKCKTGFYANGFTFKNATINFKSQIPTWFDAYNLTLKNSSLT